MNLNEQILIEHINSPEFQKGISEGRWGLNNDDTRADNIWPNRLIWINCNIPDLLDKYFFKFDFTGYNSDAANAIPWDITNGNTLPVENWPKGSQILEKVFRPSWRKDGLYVPFDRVAIKTHSDWPTKYSNKIWKPGDNVIEYINYLHGLLNPVIYEG